MNKIKNNFMNGYEVEGFKQTDEIIESVGNSINKWAFIDGLMLPISAESQGGCGDRFNTLLYVESDYVLRASGTSNLGLLNGLFYTDFSSDTNYSYINTRVICKPISALQEVYHDF